MINEYNSQYFTKEMVAKGEMSDFIKMLCTQSYGAGKMKNDIHIKAEDLGAFVVEWVQQDWKDEWSDGSFKFVAENQEVMNEVLYPDGSYEYIQSDKVEEVLKEWLDNHPTWHKNEWGVWTEDISTDWSCDIEED